MLTFADGVVSTELNGDLAAIAKERGGRKIMRLLESMSIPPFAVVTELLCRHQDLNVADLALLSVSAWEPEVPADTPRHDGTFASREQQARYMQETVNPTLWLSAMPNNMLCQAATAIGLHGPNAHWVGDGAALGLCLQFLDGLLARDAAPAAVVVAFDPPVGLSRVAPGSVDSTAAALLITNDEGPTIDVEDILASEGLRAVDVAAGVVGKFVTHRRAAGPSRADLRHI